MERPGISQTDKIFSLTSISFDAMVMETYFPLFLSMYRNIDEDTRRELY
jgi:hypothetical protein